VKARVLTISYWADSAPFWRVLVAGKVAPCWSQIGPKLEPSGPGRSWPQVQPMLRPCWIETVHLLFGGRLGRKCTPTWSCTSLANCCPYRLLLNYHASAPSARVDHYQVTFFLCIEDRQRQHGQSKHIVELFARPASCAFLSSSCDDCTPSLPYHVSDHALEHHRYGAGSAGRLSRWQIR
jgi:hypothetical protein